MTTAPTPQRWYRETGMGASILVSAISTAFGVLLLTTTEFIATIIRSDADAAESGTVRLVLSIMTALLLGLAVYVAAIVVSNTFATIVAGRTRRIALMRLIGATARSQRAVLGRQGLAVGAVGAVLGTLIGVAGGWVGVRAFEAGLGLPQLDVAFIRPDVFVPGAIVALTTWAAAWIGSRRVLAVTPLQALGAAGEPPHEELARRTGRNVTAVVLFVIGTAMLAGGVLLGMLTPMGVVVAFFGGVFSFAGIVLGATLVMPPLLRLVGRAFGGAVTARLAAENALRHPERTSRMAIGVVIGVTLVSMFSVTTETVKAVVARAFDGEVPAEFAMALDGFAAIMAGLVGVSAIIAGVGLVNLLVLGVTQRTRELGLLRALGLTSAQIRRVVLLEAAHVTITSVVLGLVLGTVYGWAGAQSLMGSSPTADGGDAWVLPAVPVPAFALIVAATAVLTLIASVVPTRLATRVTPVTALAAA
ncbi:ABC transporter permease [Microbacterium sp. GXF7504]